MENIEVKVERIFKPDQTYTLELDGEMVLCSIVGYNDFEVNNERVTVQIVTDKGRTYRRMYHQDALHEMLKVGSKLAQVLK